MVRQDRAAMTVEKLRQIYFLRVFWNFTKSILQPFIRFFFPLKVIGEIPVASL
jgi:hypothetical protein